MIKDYNGNIDELVFAIGNLHYDLTAKILEKIADEITQKAYELNSSKLRDISNCVYEAMYDLESAWYRCKDRMDGECSKHPRHIPGYNGTIAGLAKEISSSPKLILFLDKLGDDLLRQADADRSRKRKKLARNLYDAANSLYKVRMET